MSTRPVVPESLLPTIFLNLFSDYGIKKGIIHKDFDPRTDPYYVADIAILLVSVSMSNQVLRIKGKNISFYKNVPNALTGLYIRNKINFDSS